MKIADTSFNGTAIVAFFKIPLAGCGLGWASVFSSNLVLYSKDLKFKPEDINHKLPVVLK